MALGRPGGVTRKSLSALSSCPKEEVTFTWRIEKLKEVLEVAAESDKEDPEDSITLRQLKFFVGGKGGDAPSPSIPLVWSLKWWRNEESVVGVCLKWTSDDAMVEGGGTSSRDLVVRCDVQVSVGSKNTVLCNNDQKVLSNLEQDSDPIYWDISDFDKIGEHLDEEGTLTLLLKTTAYLANGRDLCVAEKEDEAAKQLALELEEKCLRGLVTSFASLLGDERTSDLKISVVDGEEEVGSFFCHWNILSARSRVFRAMFEMDEAIEKREGVVRMDDVSVKVVDQFLTFLYSGRLKDKRKARAVDPIWVKMLPDLAYIAVKYDVKDLKEFCEANLHRAVTKKNAAEVLKLARRHGLGKAEAKLRAYFAENVDVLVESLLK